jgi:predicted GTPase
MSQYLLTVVIVGPLNVGESTILDRITWQVPCRFGTSDSHESSTRTRDNQ